MGIFRRLNNLIWKIWIQMKQIQDGILVKRRCGYCGYKFWFDTSGMSVPVNDIIFVCKGAECNEKHETGLEIALFEENKLKPKKPDMRLKENKLKYGKKGTK
jgi:hypothetical protein